MLSSLEIKNFKGIREGKISDLSQVNVLVGRNNSGKSTVLDALLLMRCAFARVDYLKQDGLEQPLRRRIDRGALDYRELRYMLRTELPVILTAHFLNGGEVNQDWQPEQQMAMVTATANVGASREKRVRPQAHEDIEQMYSQLPATWSELGEASVKNIMFMHFVHLVDSTTLQGPFLEKIWGKLFLDRRDRQLADMINQIYALDVEVFNQADLGSYNRMTAGLPDRGVAVDWLGDGLRYALNILALGMLLEGTILMVEELETHQHPEALKKLTQTLFELAKKQNLQLFLTTHSWELMTHALDSAEQTGVELAFHHLDLDTSGTLKTRAIPSPDAKLLMDIGHDPRRIYKYTSVQ